MKKRANLLQAPGSFPFRLLLIILFCAFPFWAHAHDEPGKKLSNSSKTMNSPGNYEFEAEADISLEIWMTDISETSWMTAAEGGLQYEDWMTDLEDQWLKNTVEPEPAIEDWMVEPNRWLK